MKNKIIRFIALCLLVCITAGAFSSCDNFFGTTTTPETKPDEEKENPPSSDNGGEGEKEETYSEKGIFFSSKADGEGDGTIEKPYNSLEIISTLTLEPGSHIYIQSGSEFTGNLVLENLSGTAKDPIVVTSYGEGSKPKIDGNDLEGSGVLYIIDCSYLTVKNLELTDSATTEGDRRGVLVVCNGDVGSDEVVTYRNIKLQNLYVHDIMGYRDAENSGMDMSSKITGGIHLWSNDGLGRVDGFEVTGCEIEEVSNVGVATWYKVVKKINGSVSTSVVSPYTDDFKTTGHANVSINNNKIHHIGKNAIFARNLDGGVIEYNVVHDTAIYCVSGNSIVTRSVDGTVIQYNEGYRNMAKGRESDGKLQDGCMLDADLDSKDTIWQYNYSHDNAFGLFLNCTEGNDVATVRYNLSVNDKGGKGVIYINYGSAGIYVYNNTIVTGYDTEYIIQTNSGTESYFYNNIIYNRSTKARFSISGDVTAEYNLVYSEMGSISNINAFKNINKNGIYKDPEFVELVTETAILGINRQSDFRLSDTSPALKDGKDVAEVADFFGNEYRKSIGFYCGK